MAEPEKEELLSKIGAVAADLTERLRQLNQTIDSVKEISELTLEKELRALRRSNQVRYRKTRLGITLTGSLI